MAKMLLRGLLVLLLGWMGAAAPVLAGEAILLAAGAGYKKPFEELCERFVEETGIEVRRLYGNIHQILTQAKRDGRVDVIIGEGHFFEHSGLRFDRRVPLGEGRPVLAYARGVRLVHPEDVVSLARVAMPDPRQAIFGRAAREYIEHAGLHFDKAPMVVTTVPQVAAYLASGEIDAGFINLTEALALGERIGGWIELPRGSYTPILIEAGLPAEEEPHPLRERFVQFLASDEARAILSRRGL